MISRIHFRLRSARTALIDGVDTAALEKEIHAWRDSWPGSKDDQASQTYAQLLSLQALCLLYRPCPANSQSLPNHLAILHKHASEALTIYQATTGTTRDLATLAWRYQVVITVLYATSQSGAQDQDQIRAQIESCRQVVASGSDFKELNKVESVFEQLAELLLGGVESEIETAEAANRILDGLYAPLDSGSEEVRGTSSRAVEARKDHNEGLLWDHLI
jgi:hypothetical protein